MGFEIERKFLVEGDWGDKSNCVHLDQGYLNIDPDRTVRVRIQNDTSILNNRCAFLTIKGRNVGIVRTEFEYEIPVIDAEQMLSMCRNRISKYRYTILENNINWYVDVFTGGLELTLAEVELNNKDDIVSIPNWVGREVSNDCSYYNVNLASLKNDKKSKRLTTEARSY